MAKKRVLIIGLDGATWDIYGPMMDRGHLTWLEGVRRAGCWGAMWSTAPPVTPPAWTTLMTGVNPGKHQIFGFETYDRSTGRARITTAQDNRAETMWTYLSRLGHRVVSLNLPWTYPPSPVNGVMVSGYGCPGPQFGYTHPAAFQERIEREIPGYSMVPNWEKADADDEQAFDRNLAGCRRAFDDLRRLVDLAEGEVPDWEVLLVEIQQPDLMQHHILDDLAPGGGQEGPQRAAKVLEMLDHMDGVMGAIAARATGPEDLLIVASDHGFGELRAKILVNNLLQQWGLLKHGPLLVHLVRRLVRNARRYWRRAGPWWSKARDLTEALLPDWSRTRAYVAMGSQYGMLYCHLREFHSEGVMQFGEEYEALLEELRGRLLALRDPRQGGPVFAAVERPERFYGLSVRDCPALPDLVLAAAEGYLVTRAFRGGSFLKYNRRRSTGCHRANGLWAMGGEAVKPGLQLEAHLADIVPTVYAFLGVPLPGGLDGRVLAEAFCRPPEYSLAAAGAPARPLEAPSAQRDVNRDEQELIARRLAELGYLE